MPKPSDRLQQPLRLPLSVTTTSEAATEAAGEALASLLGPGDVVALTGPLGAGKTCFTRGLVRGLGAREPVASPTFTLVREHRGRLPVRHVDLYRLDPREVEELDWRDLFYGPAVAVVEWAEKAEAFLPARRFLVDIQPDPGGDPGRRVLTISAGGPEAGDDRAGAARPAEAGQGPPPATGAARPAGAVLPAGAVSPGATTGVAPTRTRRRVGGPPARALAIDTSTRSRSLAALAGDEVLEHHFRPGRGDLRAEDLSASLSDLLTEAGLAPRDIELVAVALGPGSFTGVRVGLAAAKALAYALGCAVKGVGTLDVLAAGEFHRLESEDASQPRAVLAFLDARRGEVFGAAYLGRPEPLRLGPAAGGPYALGPPAGGSYAVGPAAVVADTAARALLGALSPGPNGLEPARPTRLKVVVTGDAADACVGFARAALHRLADVDLAPPDRRDPRAADLVLLARERLVSGGGDDPFALQPLYLREPDISLPAAAASRRPVQDAGPATEPGVASELTAEGPGEVSSGG